MRALALITTIIFLIVNSGCAYTRKNIIPENDSSMNVSKQSSGGEYFIAKKGSLIFHKPNCKYLRARGYLLDPEDIVVFKSKKAAIKANYIPCPLCKPDFDEGRREKEERRWFTFILCLLGIACLADASVAASFSGGEGFSLGIYDE